MFEKKIPSLLISNSRHSGNTYTLDSLDLLNELSEHLFDNRVDDRKLFSAAKITLLNEPITWTY